MKLVEMPFFLYNILIRKLDESVLLQGMNGILILILSVFIPAVLTNWPQHNIFWILDTGMNHLCHGLYVMH